MSYSRENKRQNEALQTILHGETPEKRIFVHMEDLERIIKVLPDIVKTLRRISPVNIDVDKLEIQGEKVYVN